MTKFALAPPPAASGVASPAPVSGSVLEDAYQALVSVGHSPQEAREQLDRVLEGGKAYQSVEEMLLAIYNRRT